MTTPHREQRDRGKHDPLHSIFAFILSPVDIAGLVFFRISFYSIMLWEAWRFIAPTGPGVIFQTLYFILNIGRLNLFSPGRVLA